MPANASKPVELDASRYWERTLSQKSEIYKPFVLEHFDPKR